MFGKIIFCDGFRKRTIIWTASKLIVRAATGSASHAGRAHNAGKRYDEILSYDMFLNQRIISRVATDDRQCLEVADIQKRMLIVEKIINDRHLASRAQKLRNQNRADVAGTTVTKIFCFAIL